jgi:hypothetical protein
MPDKSTLIASGVLEIPNSLKTNPDRVLQYFKVATGKPYSRVQALQVSWCQFFAYWLLADNGFDVGPAADDGNRYGAIKQKVNQYRAHAKGTYTPQQGDLYYAPTRAGKDVHHVGFIVDVRGPNRYLVLDGNGGSIKNPATDWTYIGGGMVSQGEMEDDGVNNIIREFLEVI